jgi:hypothetical protein
MRKIIITVPDEHVEEVLGLLEDELDNSYLEFPVNVEVEPSQEKTGQDVEINKEIAP